MNETTKFGERSLAAAAQFLQTAVVIDDRAFRNDGATSEPIQELMPPDSLATADVSGDATVEVVKDAGTVDPNPHGIDAPVVIDAFADLGIVCSVLRREPDEDLTTLTDRAHKLSMASDISIVDWQVQHADGENSHEETLQFLESAVAANMESNPEQLRLIIVYTGTLKLDEVATAITERLQRFEGFASDAHRQFAFRIGAIRLVILGKPSNKRPAELSPYQVNDDGELAERAVKEFAFMSTGLVSNVAVMALAEIRKATHRLLTRFSTELDPPFLAHRALLNPPSEGNDQLLPLIVSEIEAILEDKVPQDLLSDETIRDWLDTRPDILPLIDFAPHIKTEEAARVMIKELCTKGINDHAAFTVPNEPTWIKKLASERGVSDIGKLTNLIAGETVQSSSETLELLMSLRSRYGERPPMLTLGTLLKLESQRRPRHRHLSRRRRGRLFREPREVQGTTYWLCLQPVCDAYIRAGAPRRHFPLLELRLTDERFNLIVNDDDKVIRLRWEPKPYRIRMVEFEMNSKSKGVEAEVTENRFSFRPTNGSTQFKWLGQLKPPQAQRVAQALSAEAGRIGLTESEWLRRNAK